MIVARPGGQGVPARSGTEFRDNNLASLAEPGPAYRDFRPSPIWFLEGYAALPSSPPWANGLGRVSAAQMPCCGEP